ncbi:MAG: Cna B-type domain-containing protein [Acutalibacteraceae bacterium]
MKSNLKRAFAVLMATLMLISAMPLNVVLASVAIPDLLDRDAAVISSFSLCDDDETESGYAVRTGNAPWDGDSLPGNDENAYNNIVRTFDSVTYEMFYETDLFDETVQEGISGYKEGSVCFEYILPCTPEEAIFDEGAMGWLVTNKQVTYEIVEEDIDFTDATDVTLRDLGVKKCQVLRGSFLLSPNSSNPSAIGASYNTNTVAIRVLNMQNGDIFQPIFTMWLAKSNVGITYKNAVSGKSAGIPETLVYKPNHENDFVCDTHNQTEYHSFIAPPVLVSAAPSYNVHLKKASSNNNTTLGTFDFSTGNELAQNKDAGEVTGRMYGFGLTLQIVAPTATKGLMGVELPDGSDITFDLKLKSKYGSLEDTALYNDYRAIFWSGDENMVSSVNKDGRENLTVNTQILSATPYNRDTNGSYKLSEDYSKCKNGGDWSFVVDEEDNSIIHVTVSGYEVDLSCLPYTHSDGGSGSYYYYNPNAVGSQYWKVGTACISAGKVWVVQPYYNKDGVHIKDFYGSGNTLNTSLEDFALDMTGISGVSTIDIGQSKTNDDIDAFDYIFQRPGSETTIVRYTRKDSGTALTTNCANTNADWAINGQTISLNVYTASDGAEGLKSCVAMSNMVKFDDVFFEPTHTTNFSASAGGAFKSPEKNIYWGAKPDKTGWDHKGLMPDEAGYDEEMLRYTSDDLIWFSSLTELKESGYIPVACYFEQIGLTNTSNGANNRISPIVTGKIKMTCDVNYAYMLTCESYIWNKQDVAQYVADANDATIPELTDEQYDAFVKSDAFFRRSSNTSLEQHEVQPHFKHNSKHSSAFLSSIKAVYDEGRYIEGTNAPNYIDSCYVIPFKTQIVKSVAQTNNDAANTTKKVYDMGQNQRVVDYYLNPTVISNPGDGDSDLDVTTTTVTITDTLPKGLTYIMGSAVYDKEGDKTYTQGEYWQTKGTVEGAERFAPAVTLNDDGTTTLTWVIKDIVIDPNEYESVNLGLIYFSASIGTPLNESTDVVNQQQLTNTVTVHCDRDVNCEYREEYGNLAIAAIEILKQTGMSLVKYADSDAIDVGQPIGYTMYFGNNGGNSIKDAVIYDMLPYNGDKAGSNFTGELYITRLAATTDKTDIYKKFDYYYTTDTKYRTYNMSDDVGVLGETNKEVFANNPDWIKLELSEGDLHESLFKNLPTAEQQQGDGQIVSFVAVGDISNGDTLKFHLDLIAPEMKTNERLTNTFSCGRLHSESTVVVISRKLTGKVWIDADDDGKYDKDEELLNDVDVALFIKDENGNFVPYTYTDIHGNVIKAEVPTGKIIDMVNGEIRDGEFGKYGFENLPEGEYKVVFNGEEYYDDIIMPSASELKGAELYEVVRDLPISLTSVTMTKVWDDQDDLDKLRGPYGVTLYADGEPVRDEVILQADELTYTWTGLPISKNGKLIEYTVVETTVPKGYTPTYNGFEIVNTHTPPKEYIPIIFFAPDNISFYLAPGITYYESSDGERKHVTQGGYFEAFHDSTTIYVERGTYISFTDNTYFQSHRGDYLTAIKSGENATTALPLTVEADENGYFNFRATDGYYFITMVAAIKDPDTEENKPWYQFLIDFFQKIKEFFANLFG